MKFMIWPRNTEGRDLTSRERLKICSKYIIIFNFLAQFLNRRVGIFSQNCKMEGVLTIQVPGKLSIFHFIPILPLVPLYNLARPVP